jgi:hypothetical protein
LSVEAHVVQLEPEYLRATPAGQEERGQERIGQFRPDHITGRRGVGRKGARRKRTLSRLVRQTSAVLSPVFRVPGRGRELFVAAQRLDLEGIVAKRLADPYTPDTVWRKIRNPAYTQMEGRRELFHPR